MIRIARAHLALTGILAFIAGLALGILIATPA